MGEKRRRRKPVLLFLPPPPLFPIFSHTLHGLRSEIFNEMNMAGKMGWVGERMERSFLQKKEYVFCTKRNISSFNH